MNKCLGPLLLYTAVFVFGVGCSSPNVAKTPPSSAYRSVPSVPEYANKKVQIISDPPGARIEVNNDYVGDAPITLDILNLYGSEQFSADTVIRAIPNEAGDFVQVKHFAGHLDKYGTEKSDQIPSRIFFNMHLGPVTPAVDVNVIPAN
ncbi:MAG TPA: PEGA domain-containing protein [Chthoniobacterales bacterium]|nr:PEGA domain-containing protein [Chthoniobacterales bacterium]